ncbi:MAG TPA: tRNA (N(6)-L-threonylcarbamoyladenosine(37)-C(2))-methylthiotransferase MtaB [Clostridiales bacterium]|nr:tRNA (N(6)-L-threonylcarbamoyladenosine(37)-C(2))-methylthiotransferase MtaB [Clostridiales bacterium]
MEKIRAAFHTLGCKTNHYETDAIRKQFSQAGFCEVPFDSYAEVYLVNTCTVTGEAGRKSRQMLRRARKINPAAIVVAMGCHSELEGRQDAVDIVIGTQGKSQALDRVCAELDLRGMPVPGNAIEHQATTASACQDDYEELGLVSRQSETRAYVKIEDGCDNYCSYCTIPYARGHVRSRPAGTVLAETAALAAAGYREIVLTGIHICSYGADHGFPSHAVMDLALEMAQVDGIDRIRLGSLEPQSVTPQFINLAVKNPKLLPHFHLSLQSGCDSVLRRMNRHYSAEDYRCVVNQLRQAYGKPGLTTDVIVGFPGETEDEHRTSYEFCREIAFSRLHVFRYSRREGTRAADMPNQINPQTTARRSQDMLSLADQMALTYHLSQVGRPQEVLLEKQREDGCFEGYSPEYVPIRLAARPDLQEGQIITATGIEATREFLFCC